MYHGNKVKVLSNDKSIISNTKSTVVVIDLSVIVCTNASVTTAKTFAQFFPEVVCRT